MPQIGQSIKNLRTEKGWSQAQLAKRLKVTEGTVRMWENGDSAPKIGYLPGLSELFSVSVDCLLGLEKPSQALAADTSVDIQLKGEIFQKCLDAFQGTDLSYQDAMRIIWELYEMLEAKGAEYLQKQWLNEIMKKGEG